MAGRLGIHYWFCCLIQLYIVGVFISFTLSQVGMVRYWTRQLKTSTDATRRKQMRRSRVVNAIGVFGTGVVLIIVLLTKVTRGAGSPCWLWPCCT